MFPETVSIDNSGHGIDVQRWHNSYVMIAVVVLLSLLGASLGQDEYTTVNPPSGPTRGLVGTFSEGRVASQFLGIPFAQPPVGPLRFSPPEPLAPTEAVRDATTYGSSCLQSREFQRQLNDEWIYETTIANLVFDEDCLFLNVFVPGLVDTASEAKPVMVYIYGGGFNLGSSTISMHDGVALALNSDVIVVTLNYRLGALGFLTTGDENVPGNAGILDQVMALRWVQENIGAYGGDPNNVLIFGESAGAASAIYHMISPVSQGLFHKVISQSGLHGGLVATLPVEIISEFSYGFGEEAACFATDSLTLVDCLRQVSSEDFKDLVEATEYPFWPVVDGFIIPNEIDYLLETGQFERVPLMAGTTSEDGTVAMAILDEPFTNGVTTEDAEFMIDLAALATGYLLKLEEIFEALKGEFFPDITQPMENTRSLLNMLRGVIFVAPAQHHLKYHIEWGVPAYQYEFSRRPDFAPTFPDIELGAAHAHDVFFTLGALTEDGFMADNSTAAEKMLSHSMMAAWGSFARTGTPTILTTEGESLPWPEYTLEEKAYVDFDINMSAESIKSDLKPRDDVFWNELIPAIGESFKY